MRERLSSFLVIMICAEWFLAPVYGAENKVMLMLGGEFCDAYLDEVEEAVKKVVGVKAVDLKSMKGHAVVTVDASKAKPEQIVHAVNQVKGQRWHCTAQIMK
ncbi:hypothetical protein DNFV4_00946 [Nitrospira tepida]|uniref:HMA domain-containing protein n=1 Tax=Nitrospira tepida TaxID=2973512 RepID=A0AA86T9T5_9BACT|nr:cation transporter [Nitrospira tepida]CAI4030518.1 hypothetical protein DNFV4_00946 [Nitrospira tepida]